MATTRAEAPEAAAALKNANPASRTGGTSSPRTARAWTRAAHCSAAPARQWVRHCACAAATAAAACRPHRRRCLPPARRLPACCAAVGPAHGSSARCSCPPACPQRRCRSGRCPPRSRSTLTARRRRPPPPPPTSSSRTSSCSRCASARPAAASAAAGSSAWGRRCALRLHEPGVALAAQAAPRRCCPPVCSTARQAQLTRPSLALPPAPAAARRRQRGGRAARRGQRQQRRQPGGAGGAAQRFGHLAGPPG